MNISLSFKTRFAADVESGKKRQTIRQDRKRVADFGDTLHLFTGMRTKACRKLGDVKCLHSEVIWIDPYRCYIFSRREPDVIYSYKQSLEIAKLDGFMDLLDFYGFFRQQYGEGIHKMRLYRW